MILPHWRTELGYLGILAALGVLLWAAVRYAGWIDGL